jgi:hypothetical protein
VKLHEYTESPDQFVIFMEYCNDAEYFDNKIVDVSPIPSVIPQLSVAYLLDGICSKAKQVLVHLSEYSLFVGRPSKISSYKGGQLFHQLD